MTCVSIRERLGLRGIGELSAEEDAHVAAHLETCAECRREHAAMRQTLALLDQHPPSLVSVDVSRIYRQSLDRQRLQSRRWRRAALVGLAAAAALLFAIVLPQLELSVEQQQVTLRWGTPEQSVPRAPRPESPEYALARDQVRVLSELVQGQRDELEAQSVKLERVQDRLDKFQQVLAVGASRWRSTERDVAALFGMQSTSSKTGEVHE